MTTHGQFLLPIHSSLIQLESAKLVLYIVSKRDKIKHYPPSSRHPVAYFSLEFGIKDELPIYSGGLGVLAGDVLKEARDQGLPMVGVGLFYREGYFLQVINDRGEQEEEYRKIEPTRVLKPVLTPAGTDLTIKIELPDRILTAKVWKFSMDGIDLYLLDTNIEENTPSDRDVTRRLYGGSKETRLLQEIVLGIGGERALYAKDIHPSVYHLNEGHSAFCVFEITHHVMKETGLSFYEAFELAKTKIVFTNHTLVSAGNDVFAHDLIKAHVSEYAKHLNFPIAELISLGTPKDKPQSFAMTTLALNMSCRVNAVSKLHAVAAQELWPDHSLVGITNGVHLPTWVNDDLQAACAHFSLSKLDKLTDKDMWNIHTNQKKNLMKLVKQQNGADFDPQVATMVWARRFATYKQPALLFSEIDSLKRISKSAHGALQIIIAGKAHPEDKQGKELIAYINSLIKANGLSSWVTFLPDYCISVAKYLVSGADIWLNTPIRGKEASGTSGMKAGANGVLQFSVADGWTDEVELDKVGWKIDARHTAHDLYADLEHDILPLYYTLDSNGYSSKWVKEMRNMIEVVWKKYSAKRMLSEYIDVLYKPAWEQVDYHTWESE